MKNYVQKNGTKFELAAGITTKVLLDDIQSFGKSLESQWGILTDITVGVIVHYWSQEQVLLGKKGDTTGVAKLADVLADNNNSMYRAYSTVLGKVCGLTLEIGEDLQMKVGMNRKTREGLKSSLFSNLSELEEKGIKSYMPERKQSGGKRGGGSADEAPSDPLSVSVGGALVQDTIGKVLSNLSTPEQQERLKEFAPLMAELLQLVTDCPNKGLVKDQLGSVVGKLRKGMSMSAVVSKAG